MSHDNEKSFSNSSAPTASQSMQGSAGPTPIIHLTLETAGRAYTALDKAIVAQSAEIDALAGQRDELIHRLAVVQEGIATLSRFLRHNREAHAEILRRLKAD